MSYFAFITILLFATNNAQPKNDPNTQNSVKSDDSQIIEQILPFPLPDLSKALPSSSKLKTSPLILINDSTPPRTQPSIPGSKKKPFPKTIDLLMKYDFTTKRPFPKRTQANIASIASATVPIANDNSPVKYLRQGTKPLKPQITVATVVLNQASKITNPRHPRDNKVKPIKSTIRAVKQVSANSEQVQDINDKEETYIDRENESYVKEQEHEAEDIKDQRDIENLNEKYNNREGELKHVNEDDQEYQETKEEYQETTNRPQKHQLYKNVHQDHRNIRAPKNKYQAPKKASEKPYKATQIDYHEDEIATQLPEPKNVLRTSYTSDSYEDSDDDDNDDGPVLRNGEMDDEDLNYNLDGVSLRQWL